MHKLPITYVRVAQKVHFVAVGQIRQQVEGAINCPEKLLHCPACLAGVIVKREQCTEGVEQVEIVHGVGEGEVFVPVLAYQGQTEQFTAHHNEAFWCD